LLVLRRQAKTVTVLANYARAPITRTNNPSAITLEEQ
jgi:hypothetical protein